MGDEVTHSLALPLPCRPRSEVLTGVRAWQYHILSNMRRAQTPALGSIAYCQAPTQALTRSLANHRSSLVSVRAWSVHTHTHTPRMSIPPPPRARTHTFCRRRCLRCALRAASPCSPMPPARPRPRPRPHVADGSPAAVAASRGVGLMCSPAAPRLIRRRSGGGGVARGVGELPNPAGVPVTGAPPSADSDAAYLKL